MYIDNTQQMDGLFSKVGKAVNKVMSAPLKVATKVASKVLPNSVERAALAVPKLVTNMTAKTVTAAVKVPDAIASPIARGIKKNPVALQAAGAVASVIPGMQPVGAALIGSGRIIQQRNAQREQKQAAEQATYSPAVIAVPSAGGPVAAAAPAKDNTALYVGAGVAAVVALLALTNRPTRR